MLLVGIRQEALAILQGYCKQQNIVLPDLLVPYYSRPHISGR